MKKYLFLLPIILALLQSCNNANIQTEPWVTENIESQTSSSNKNSSNDIEPELWIKGSVNIQYQSWETNSNWTKSANTWVIYSWTNSYTISNSSTNIQSNSWLSELWKSNMDNITITGSFGRTIGEFKLNLDNTYFTGSSQYDLLERNMKNIELTGSAAEASSGWVIIIK